MAVALLARRVAQVCHVDVAQILRASAAADATDAERGTGDGDDVDANGINSNNSNSATHLLGDEASAAVAFDALISAAALRVARVVIVLDDLDMLAGKLIACFELTLN